MAEGFILPTVDKQDPTPKYVQAQRILIDAIRNGDLLPGVKLPATKEVGALVNVSLITAHRALEGLVESGWLRREVGRGTYVREDVDPVAGSRREVSVGILLDHQDHVNIDDYYHSTILDGLRREARNGPLRIEFFFHDRLDLRGKGGRNAGAICIHPPLQSQAKVESLAERHPVVVLGGSFPGHRVPCVDCDNAGGARDAVCHLAGLGHERFLVLSGPLDMSNSRDRAEGAVVELAGRGLRLPLENALESGDSVVLDDRTRAALQRRLCDADRPTAIVAGGFYLALAAMQVVRSVGFSIPRDVSIVGFDDPVSAPLLDPPLTTVRQPLAEMASQACKLIRLAMTEGQSTVASCQLPTELIVRGSTAPVS